ncbi:hypothetical protein FRC00_000244 [Tulasnella sp. 408]|nr:hypothetical protein FRC00_000244 [Tulasnella sp. 408]
MPTGPLASERNPATSLSKYFHDLPDPDQRSIDFCNTFWGPNDCGVEVLFARMDAASRTMEELRAFWKERDLRTALNAFRVETFAQAGQHVNLVQTIKRQLDQPSNNFINKQNSHKKTFRSAVEKLHKTKQTQEEHTERARSKYETDCLRMDSYTAQSAILQGTIKAMLANLEAHANVGKESGKPIAM